MMYKCKINGETLILMFVCICQIFEPYHVKMVSVVPDNIQYSNVRISNPEQNKTGAFLK